MVIKSNDRLAHITSNGANYHYCYTLLLLSILNPFKTRISCHLSKALPVFIFVLATMARSHSLFFCSQFSVRILLVLTTGESPVTDDCRFYLSGLQFAIYSSCCEKRLETIRHLQHPHVRYSILAGTTSLCLQTWRNDAVPCSNFPRKPTRTFITSLPFS